MDACSYEWIGLVEWWSRMDAPAQAAWAQAFGTIIAIFVAILVPYWQKRQEQRERSGYHRKLVMSTAANLDITLSQDDVIFSFAPAGNGAINHECNLQQAADFMRLRPESRIALQKAIDMSHYFNEELCEKIVILGIEASANERKIDETLRKNHTMSADYFFSMMTPRKNRLHSQLQEVRNLLQEHLPSTEKKHVGREW